MAKITMGQVVNKLMCRDYYSTVYVGFIEEAVENAVREHGTFKDLDELDKYIRENLI